MVNNNSNPTERDIARLAGCSVATVSRVFNESQKVTPATEARVMEAAKKLGYKFNLLARGFSLQKSFMVAIILPTAIKDSFYGEFVSSVEEQLFRNGYATYLCNSKNSIDKEAEYLEAIMSRRVDGIIIVPISTGQDNRELVKRATDSGIPIVFWDRYLQEIDADYIGTENFKSTYNYIKELLDKGYHRIIFLGTDAASSTFERLRGYREAFKDSGMPINEENIFFDIGHPSYLEKFFNKDTSDLAFFCVNSGVCETLLWYMKENKLYSHDIPIVTFDETVIGDCFGIPVTCIVQNSSKMGKVCARILLKRISQRDNNLECKSIRIMPLIKKRLGYRTS